CALKPQSVSAKTAGKTLIPLLNDVAVNPPKVCAQQSVTFPPDAGGKYRQDIWYATPEWHETYAVLRNGSEGLHGDAKDGAHRAGLMPAAECPCRASGWCRHPA